MSPRHIVVLGAARSGTKMLRDALARATGVGMVPYDISYVWRHGNEGRRDDRFDIDATNESTRRLIRRFIDRYAEGDPPAVIEKTVGNTLRVPFVAAIFRDACYVHLIRDGVDVIESARRQWTAPVRLRYLAAKARHVPPRLLPRYGAKYVRSIALRRTRADGRVGTWGPRYPGIDADLRHEDLLTVCARQWRVSTTQARSDLARLGLPAVEVRYEALATDPVGTLAEVAGFAGLSTSDVGLADACRWVDPNHLGIGRRTLSAGELATIDDEAGALLEELGYGLAWSR